MSLPLSQAQGPNSSYTVWHIHYNTHIVAGSRPYGINGTPTLPDGTVAFFLCKAQSSPNAVISLDAVTFIPMPGPPANVHTSFVFAIGHITGAAETLDDGHLSRAVLLRLVIMLAIETPLPLSGTAIFLFNTKVLIFFRAVYDLSTARFKSTPIPALNSCVEIYGACRELNPTGILCIKVESIVLNVGANPNASAPHRLQAASTPQTPETPEIHTTNWHSTGPYNPMGHYTPYFSHYYGQPSPFPMTAQYPPYFLSPQFLPDHKSSIPKCRTDDARQIGSPSARTSDQHSAFLKSAADPYAYPMTQRR
ncbi:hypothetical protein B0H19DRAFT_1200832, partial [Mycena capillaripes]